MTDQPATTPAADHHAYCCHVLREQRDEARAQVVACQTAADDLRARVQEAADWLASKEAEFHDKPDVYSEGVRDAYDGAEGYVRWALKPPESASAALDES